MRMSIDQDHEHEEGGSAPASCVYARALQHY